MLFTALTLYTLKEPIETAQSDFQQALTKTPFTECHSSQSSSQGWVNPLTDEPHGETVVTVGQWSFIALRIQEKILPAKAINELASKQIKALEQSEGRKLSGKEKNQIKENVKAQHLPNALTKSKTVHAFINDQYIGINTQSAKTAETLMSQLRENLGSLAIQPVTTQSSPDQIMSQWLRNDTDRPTDINVLNKAVLTDSEPDETGKVSISNLDLFSEEVQSYIDSGMTTESLEIEFEEEFSAKLQSSLVLKSIKFEGARKESIKDEAADDPALERMSELYASAEQTTAAINTIAQAMGGLREST